MLDKVIVFFLIASVTSCFGQHETTRIFVRQNGGEFDHLDVVINGEVRGLQYWKEGDDLPEFLYNEDFDFLRRKFFVNNCYSDQEWIPSTRKAIFDRVYNEEVLRAIADATDTRLDEKYDPEYVEWLQGPGPKIFWMDFSTRELAKERLREIEEWRKFYQKKRRK